MVRLVPVLLAAAVLASATDAAAQAGDPNAEAARLSEEATTAYGRGDLDGAIALFEEAMGFVPDPAFAFNIAYIYEELGALFPAYRYYGLYLELYPGAPNRADVEGRRAELETLFATDYAELRITTTPPGAALWVRVGEREDFYGEAPLTAWVPPGSVTVEARLPGYEAATRSLNAVAGVRLPLELGLAPERAETVPVPPTRVDPLIPWGYGVLAAGVVTLGVGVAFWVAADGNAEDYNADVAAIGGGGETPSLGDLRDLGGRAEDQAAAGNVLFGVGTAVAVGGAVLLVLGYGRAPAPTGDASPPEGGGTAWRLAPLGLGLELSGRF